MAGREIVKRSRYHFGYGKKKKAKKGVYAMEIFVLAVFATMGLFAYAFTKPGAASPAAGAVGLMIMGLAGFGIWLGVQSFHEMDRTYGISKAAIVLNGLLTILYVFLFVSGL